MKIKSLLLPVVVILLFSCNRHRTVNMHEVLNPQKLSSQFFNININRDTVLLTKAGCVLNIKKGSLKSDSIFVKLELKEALSTEEIVLAGLTTMAGQQPLSSGGMIFLNPATGYRVTIEKKLEILVPAHDYIPDMQVYKGTDKEGKIDWVEPEALPKDSFQLGIMAGKELFKANCSNCHEITEDFTGPALRGITKKRTRQWIYDFIHNPAAMASKNRSAKLLCEAWSPAIMTKFVALENAAIDNILAYIETAGKSVENKEDESQELKNAVTIQSPDCRDSCRKYLAALEAVETDRSMIGSNENFFSLDRSVPVPPETAAITSPAENNFPENKNPQESAVQTVDETTGRYPEHVKENFAKATYYTVNISAFGWTNIDILLKQLSECTASELFVSLDTKEDQDNFTVALIIPAVKAFVEGGKLDNGTQFGFDETNGKIMLPQNAHCYVIAFAESNNRFLFGKKEFDAGLKQTIQIDFAETDKAGLLKQIKDLRIDGVKADIKESAAAEKSRILEKASLEAEKLRPRNCNCLLNDPPKPFTEAMSIANVYDACELP